MRYPGTGDGMFHRAKRLRWTARRLVPRVALGAVFLAVTLPAAGGVVTFTPLGIPGGSEQTLATDVSADGSVVTGFANAAGATTAFRWAQAGGFQFLESEPGASSALRMSADGSVIAGELVTTPTQRRAFRWTGSTGAALLGTLPHSQSVNDAFSTARDVTADGRVVVGWSSYYSPTSRGIQAFQWRSETGMVPLPGFLEQNPQGQTSAAAAVSADGRVIVGNSGVGTAPRAVRWVGGGQIEALGGADFGMSVADGVSADGSVIVGTRRNAAGGLEAFRWTEAEGMTGIGDPVRFPFGSRARGASGDGAVVVGRGTVGFTPTFAEDERAFIWDAAHGMRSLQEVLVNEFGMGQALTGWTLNAALEISPDGRFIAGYGQNPAGQREAWLVAVPEPVALVLPLALAANLLRRRLRRRNSY
jgi:probable HAF family extracellular repeat protein